MAKKKRLSRDQKRKAKLAKDAKRSQTKISLAIHGDKYKTDELTPVYLATETGIHETDVMTGGKLTDHVVAAALTKLVQQLRQGALPPWEDKEEVELVAGQEEDLVIWNIRRNWTTMDWPGNLTMEGVLRTLLGSIETWSTPSRHSRGYLHFLAGFMRQAGVNVRNVDPETLETLDEEDEEDELLEIGRDWYRGTDPHAAENFRDGIEDMILHGQAERAAEICQQLLGESASAAPSLTRELSELAILAQRAMPPEKP
jgi:hypothetical protein